MERTFAKKMDEAIDEGEDRAPLYALCLIGDQRGVIDDRVGTSGDVQLDQECQFDDLLLTMDQLAWITIKKMELLAYVNRNEKDGIIYIYGRVIDRDDPDVMSQIADDHTGLLR